MLQRLPVQIDPFRLAETGRMLEGQLELAGMKRLAGYLHAAEGLVDTSLSFGVDESGLRYLEGRLRAVLEVICQRCMEPMRVPVNHAFVLGLVSSEHEADRLPDGYEPLLVDSNRMLLSDIVEDELILAIPIVPMHSPAECPAGSPANAGRKEAVADEPRESPFAVLAGLKQGRDQD